jgi:hypothetical protein
MSRPHNNERKNEKSSLSNLPNSILSNKVIFVVCVIVVVALITDASLARTVDLLSTTLGRKSATTLTIFTLVSLAYFVGQFIILLFVRYRSKEIQARANVQFYKSYKITIAVQIALSVILLFIILQLVTVSYYFTAALVAMITISYALAIALMALLMKNFLFWFKTSKNFVVLAYGISAATLAVHVAFTLFFAASTFLDQPAEVRTAVPRIPFFIPGSISAVLHNIHNLTSILSFSVLWGSTVLLLHHYSKKIGRLKYWILVTLPLVYFLSQFPTLFLDVFNPIIRENPIFIGSVLTIVYTLSKPAGGILFGFAFWTVSRGLRITIAVRDYLMISALGFVLLFASDQATVLLSIPYPPFGVVAISFLGLSSYLIFVGIYYSAISLSYDDRVRREIKKFAAQESKLLDSIGSAQFEKIITEKITAIRQIQDPPSSSLGVQPSIDEDDIRKYLEDVLRAKKAYEKNHKDS